MFIPNWVKYVLGQTPSQRLARLERKALDLGMSQTEFNHIQSIGNCRQQTQDRIATLTTWIAARTTTPSVATVTPTQVPGPAAPAEPPVEEPARELVEV